MYIDTLEIFCEDDYYPSINGVQASYSPENGDFHHTYNRLNMPVDFTGKITIGNDIFNRFIGWGYINASHYKETHVLTFGHGDLGASSSHENSFFTDDEEENA